MNLPGLFKASLGLCCFMPLVAAAQWPVVLAEWPALKLVNGSEFKQVRVIAAEAGGIKIFHAHGVARVKAEMLPEEVRSQFAFDAAKALAEEEDRTAKDYAWRAKVEAELESLRKSEAKAMEAYHASVAAERAAAWAQAEAAQMARQASAAARVAAAPAIEPPAPPVLVVPVYEPAPAPPCPVPVFVPVVVPPPCPVPATPPQQIVLGGVTMGRPR